jgi:hypothetical protein
VFKQGSGSGTVTEDESLQAALISKVDPERSRKHDAQVRHREATSGTTLPLNPQALTPSIEPKDTNEFKRNRISMTSSLWRLVISRRSHNLVTKK